jgi:hypothetical protein
MLPALRFVGTAWTFLRRQPALSRCAAALVFPPLLAMDYLSASAGSGTPQGAAVLVVLYVACTALLTWGIACVLTVGKRLLQAKAGRTRTSFRAVSSQARGLVVPLLLTNILRGCVTLLWGLPFAALVFVVATTADMRYLMDLPAFLRAYPWFVPLAIVLAVPPVLYALRTVLVPMVVAYEKLGFRPALARSAQLTKRRLGRTLAMTVLLGLLWTPGIAAEVLIDALASPSVAELAAPPVTAVLDTFSLVLWLLAFTQFYKALGGKAQAQENE